MAINGKVFNDSGEAQFLVWKSSVQDAFNQHAEAISNLTSIVQRLDIAVAFLVEKAGYTPADVQEFLDKKAQEYAEKVAADLPPTILEN